MRTFTPNRLGAGIASLLLAAGIGTSAVAAPGAAAATASKGGASLLLVTSDLDTGDDATTAADLATDQADGAGLSLREALAWAQPGDSIGFDLDPGTAGNQGGSITLAGGELVIADGGLRIDGDLDDDGVPDVTLDANNASRVLLVNPNLTGVELIGLELTRGNVASSGGGLLVGSSSSVTVRNCRVTNNRENGSGGGGIYGSNVSLALINTTVSGNTAVGFGGGVRTAGGSTLAVINSTVSDNTTTGIAQHGGGIQYSGPLLTIVNSTLSGNAATGTSSFGGGLRISLGTSFVYNSTVVGNASTNDGGGVSAEGADTFVNTVVAGNTAGAGATPGASGSALASGGAPDDVAGVLETATASYFGSSLAIVTNNGSFTNQGTTNLLLDDLALNFGGGVATHFPQAGSALREAGENSALPPDSFDLDDDGDTIEPLPVDANGGPRVGAIVEIGAVETNGVIEIFYDGFEG